MDDFRDLNKTEEIQWGDQWRRKGDVRWTDVPADYVGSEVCRMILWDFRRPLHLEAFKSKG